MAVTLYTAEELAAFTTRVSCCASNQAYKAMKAKMNNSYDYKCIYNRHLYLQQALCILSGYTPTGGLLSPGIDPHAAVSATAELDLSIFDDNGTFLNTQLTILGVSLFDASSFTNGFYATIDAFGAALETAINAWTGTNGGYTASYDSATNILTLTAPTPGTSFNGIPVAVSIQQDRFFEYNEFPTVIGTDPSLVPGAGGTPSVAGHALATTPTFGCFNPQDNKVVWATFSFANDLAIVDQDGQTGVYYQDQLCRSIVYDTDRDLMYVAKATGVVQILDSGYNDQAPLQFALAGGNATKLYYDTTPTKQYLYAGTTTGNVKVFDAATPAAAAIGTIALGTEIYTITRNPVNGYIFFCRQGSKSIYAIDPATPGTLAATYTTLSAEVIQPYALEFVDNNGTWELWVGGGSSDEVFKLDASNPTTILGTVLMEKGVIACHMIKQNSFNKYVYITDTTATPPYNTIVIDSTGSNAQLDYSLSLLQTLYATEGIVEDTVTNKMFVGEGVTTSGAGTEVQVIDFERTNFALPTVFAGGEDEVTEYVPPVYATDDNSNNCVTQEEMYTIIENVKKICGCCCEFDDSVLQKDIR